MGDRFVVLVDHLHTESTSGASIINRNSLKLAKGYAKMKMLIRIWRTPCSCCGSLKYAHRKCIQRWCDEKGDTMCEICHQEFKPGYTAPTRIVHIGGLRMNLRGNWRVARRELNDPHIITMVSTDPRFQDPDNDEHAVSTSRSTSSCRIAAIILLMLQVAGIILPVCVALKAVTSILYCQQQQANASNLSI